MVLSDDRITSFVIKTLNGTLTESDKFYLAEWLENSVKNQTYFNRYCTKEYLSAELEKIYAYDEDNGNKLWSTKLQRVPEGIPAMYENGGRQYLVVCATGALIDKSKKDTEVPREYIVFALPKKK